MVSLPAYLEMQRLSRSVGRHRQEIERFCAASQVASLPLMKWPHTKLIPSHATSPYPLIEPSPLHKNLFVGLGWVRIRSRKVWSPHRVSWTPFGLMHEVMMSLLLASTVSEVLSVVFLSTPL